MRLKVKFVCRACLTAVSLWALMVPLGLWAQAQPAAPVEAEATDAAKSDAKVSKATSETAQRPRTQTIVMQREAKSDLLPPQWRDFELRFYLKADSLPPELPRAPDGTFYIDARLARQDANGFVLREITFPELFSENLIWLPAHNVLFVARL